MMKEARLYEALLERWGREYDYTMKYPDIEVFVAHEKKKKTLERIKKS